MGGGPLSSPGRKSQGKAALWQKAKKELNPPKPVHTFLKRGQGKNISTYRSKSFNEKVSVPRQKSTLAYRT